MGLGPPLFMRFPYPLFFPFIRSIGRLRSCSSGRKERGAVVADVQFGPCVRVESELSQYTYRTGPVSFPDLVVRKFGELKGCGHNLKYKRIQAYRTWGTNVHCFSFSFGHIQAKTPILTHIGKSEKHFNISYSTVAVPLRFPEKGSQL